MGVAASRRESKTDSKDLNMQTSKILCGKLAGFSQKNE
jgi:hypothetical protein